MGAIGVGIAAGWALSGGLSYDVAINRPAEETMPFTKALLAVLIAISPLAAMAADARERGFIRQGMPEGEVLFKLGKPDHEAFVQNAKGFPEEKTWTYFPDPRDPQTLSIFTFRSGVVFNIDRKIAR